MPPLSRPAARLARAFALLAGLAMLAQALAALAPARASAPAAAHQVFLPLVFNSTSRAPQPAPQRSATFLTRAAWTSSSSLAIDVAGGMHMAYVRFGGDWDQSVFVYAYCPPAEAARCSAGAGWRQAELGARAKSVQLRLTPAGQPRLLLELQPEGDAIPSDSLLGYAACDNACADPARWSARAITSFVRPNHLYLGEPQRAFALDPQGRPRVLLATHTGLSEGGTFYVWCDDACADPEVDNWYGTRINHVDPPGEIGGPPVIQGYESLYQPVLQVGPDGALHALALQSEMKVGVPYLTYLACATACDDPASWTRAPLAQAPAQNAEAPPAVIALDFTLGSYDLELDPQGRPRALIAGVDGGQPTRSYLWCDEGCADQAAWGHNEAPAALSSAELAFDRQGRPRALLSGMDQGRVSRRYYTWCDAGCEDAARWRHQEVDSGAAMEREIPGEPPLRPAACARGLTAWEGGAATMAFDAAGNPRVVGDAGLYAACQHSQEAPRPGEIIRNQNLFTLYRAVRWLSFPQPR